MTPGGDRDIFLLDIHCGAGSMAVVKRVDGVQVQPKDL